MNDSDLKKLLLETCPVRPGQEDRAWNSLRERLDHASRSPVAWLYFPTWRGATLAFVAVCALGALTNGVVHSYLPVSFASATSETPGIFATSFYSSSAQAQVVWLNGLEPASDGPSYLDPTTNAGQPAGDSSDSL